MITDLSKSLILKQLTNQVKEENAGHNPAHSNSK